MLLQAFKTAGVLFEVIDSHTESVIVPYNDESESLISWLNDDLTPKEAAAILRKSAEVFGRRLYGYKASAYRCRCCTYEQQRRACA